jgi:hypothetical protein
MLPVQHFKAMQGQKREQRLAQLASYCPSATIMKLADLVRRGTTGTRVCQYPDRTRPALFYFTEDLEPGEALLHLLREFNVQNGHGAISESNYEEHVTRFFETFTSLGWEIYYGGCYEAQSIYEQVLKHELDRGRVVGIAWSALEDDGDVHSSYRTPLERNSSDTN